MVKAGHRHFSDALIGRLVRSSGQPVRKVIIPIHSKDVYPEQEVSEAIPGVPFEYREGIDSIRFLHEGHRDLVVS